jgi:hypothetical protein
MSGLVEQPRVLVGCGILHKEVESLIRRNGWNISTHFLDSALHNYLDRLSAQLDQALVADEAAGRRPVVFYGACHPHMDTILRQHGTVRTSGQNCIVMLLGYERFMTELSRGAYFLLEDWALTWEPMITECFGTNPKVVREIFGGSHKMMIALRTPCSGDFSTAAEAAARFVGLPLEWMDVGLTNLESVLSDAILRSREQAQQ